MLKVYLVQMDSSLGTKSENLARAKKMILDAHPAAGSLVLLPEMFATGYIPASLDDAAEDFSSCNSGETARMLSEAASATSSTIMGAGITSIHDKFLNHVSIYEPGSTGEHCGYDKMNLFFPENESFRAGERINLFKIKEVPARECAEHDEKSNPSLMNSADAGGAIWNVASFICYDLRFPELFREATKQGANLITVQAAWPAKRHAHWETLLKARAIENQVYIAAVNAVSSRTDAKSPLAGTSLVISPYGDILAEGPAQSEAVIYAELDLQAEKEYRKSFPVLDGIVPPTP